MDLGGVAVPYERGSPVQSCGPRWHERCVVAKLIDAGEVSRGEKMLYAGTDPESYITEYTLVYED